MQFKQVRQININAAKHVTHTADISHQTLHT